MMTLSFRRPAALRAAALFLTVSLTACAGGSIQETPAGEAKPTLTICTEPHWQDPQALPLFRAEHPEIDLNVEYLPELYDYDLLSNTTFDWETSTGEKSAAREAAINRIKNQLMAGEGPDVFWLWVAEICDPYVYRSANNFVFSDFSKMAESGAFLDLKPLLTEELLAQMSQPFQDWVARQEHVYYLPLGYELCGALMPEAVWQAHPELLEPETDFLPTSRILPTPAARIPSRALPACCPAWRWPRAAVPWQIWRRKTIFRIFSHCKRASKAPRGIVPAMPTRTAPETSGVMHCPRGGHRFKARPAMTSTCSIRRGCSPAWEMRPSSCRCPTMTAA